MKVFSESIISEMKPIKSTSPNVLCTLSGPCMQFGVVNRNNRLYSRKLVEDRILNNPTIKECLKNHSMLGEGGHPENRVDIAYPEVALSVTKLWIPEGDGNMLWGNFDILDTPVGRILNTLAQYGTKIGISARAVADSVQKDGHEVILENSYELITFDAVTEPGFKCARLEKLDSISKSVDQMSTKELKESSAALKAFKNPVFESRIRTLDKEICKRENKVDMHAMMESIDRLSAAVNNSVIKLQNIKYEKQLKALINEAKQLVNESKTNIKNKQLNENVKISNKYNTDTNISKFDLNNHDNVCNVNEDISVNKLFNNEDNSKLERMCSHFRRTSYE